LNKAARIRKLLSERTMSPREIAEAVGTTHTYVYHISWDMRSEGGVRSYQRKYRLKHPDQRSRDRRRNYAKGRMSDWNSMGRYTNRENELILGEFEGSDRELAEVIGRSVQAIQVQRTRLRKRASVTPGGSKKDNSSP